MTSFLKCCLLLLIFNLASYYVPQPVLASSSVIIAGNTAQIALEASDLPSRFEPAPSFLQKAILRGIQSLDPNLKREGIALNKVTTFVDLEQAELILGMTANLNDRPAIEKFDDQLRRPDASNFFVMGIRRSLSGLGKVKVTKVQELSSLSGIGEMARGYAIDAEVEGLSLRLSSEVIAFRRGRRSALVVLGALNHSIEGIRAREIALQLDRRWQHSNAEGEWQPVDREITLQLDRRWQRVER